LRVNPDDVFAINPEIVYARATGQGARGPHTMMRAFDASAFWARSGLAWVHSPPDGSVAMPRPATGDLATGFNLAGGVAAALVRRQRTGKGGIVDASLLSTAMWMLGVDLGTTAARGRNPSRAALGKSMRNPMLGPYPTSDGRWLNLAMFQSDQHWPGFCAALEREDLLEDERFSTAESRTEHREELHKIFWDELGSRDLATWKERLTAHGCSWWFVAEPIEVLEDPQVLENGYLMEHPMNPQGRLTATPVQFDETPIRCRTAAPHIGEHTDDVMRAIGYDDAAIAGLRAANAIA
jgi:crotonobetainyl-CoA:carnitine CoA-transferase CaiB-like acyl-CoA transferase